MLGNPTGGKIRNDDAGLGHFRAPRGGRFHAGEDYECVPEQEVEAPCDGTFTKIGTVYQDDGRWTYVEISHHGYFRVRLFYVTGRTDLIGTRVSKGDVIGLAQDITVRYPGQGMKAHVHMGVILSPLAVYSYKGKTYLNPKALTQAQGE